ncbi:MAG: hypothetical protein APF76_04715 [Desulfitibacter sp. BRH_c19]|nr:MAG: hypothetical protein APF76_04715 [Desulfitibacter sp. BRH_c19]
MPLKLIVGFVLLPFLFWKKVFFIIGKILGPLFEKRILTIPRIIVLLLVPLFFIASFIGSVPILYIPKTILPVLQPEMTWEQVFSYLNSDNPVTGENIWFEMTIKLWKDRPPQFWLSQIPLAGALLALAFIFWRTGWPFEKSIRASKDHTHGSSRWRKTSEYRSTLNQTKCSEPDKAGIVVSSKGKNALVTNPDAGNPHTLIIGATRSGKSRRVIMPSIWSIGHNKESMIVTDPKGEIYEHTAAWLEKKGYEVILLDLLNPKEGNKYNPLSKVLINLERGDVEEASREAWEIGNILAWAYGTGNDPIWPQAEESLIASLCLATAINAPEDARHMTSAYRILTQLGADGGELLDGWFKSMDGNDIARMAYGTAALSESRTRSSIYTGTSAHLRLFADPSIAMMCSESDFNPDEAGIKPMAIFIKMPDEAGARRQIASLFVNQAYAGLANVARDNGGKLPVPVWFLLDEFGNIGKLPNLAEKLTVAAGRGIRIILAIQAKAQLEHVYGKQTAEIVLGNCDTWIYLRTADNDTAREISNKVGKYTVVTKSIQKNKYRPSESEGSTGRALLTPDEVLRWEIGNCLLLQAGQFPAKIPIQDMSSWPGLSEVFRPATKKAKNRTYKNVTTWVPNIVFKDEKDTGIEEPKLKNKTEGGYF